MRRSFSFHSNAVWPPPLLVGLFVILYGSVAACLWLIELAAPNMGNAMSDSAEILNIRTAILASAAGVYALCLSALIGWWSLCLIEHFRVEPFPELILL